ncbi:MAG: sulfatase-like hydrolase/transferase [Myxococcales bacterium]|nr:sulfatase-like hydrolase/transferase [Myxococcales bacterium]
MALPIKKRLILILKVVFSLLMLWVIVRKVVARDGAGTLAERLWELSWAWFAMAVGMMLCAVICSVVRWQRLLNGQGIRAPWSFLGPSFLIARFFGAFTPGGFTGLGGWRIYDITKHTGKAARATATIGVEMVLGQLAFGVVVMVASVYGLRFLGLSGVLLINAVFLGVMVAGITLLARPDVFRWLSRALPGGLRVRIHSLLEAVCAYRGKSRLLIQAAVLGIGTHVFNNLVYVCAARALGIPLGIGEVFFGSSLQILATLLPASINGIGLREAAAVALYTRLGMPASEAVLIPIVGFAAEMLVSASGGLLFVLRSPDYHPKIEVEQEPSERVVPGLRDALADPGDAEGPLWRVLERAASAGLWAGIGIGFLEAALVSVGGNHLQGRVFFYGPLAYGVLGLALGLLGGAIFAIDRRVSHARPPRLSQVQAYVFAGIWGVLFLALGAFRLRRDIFHEQLQWTSASGALVALGCLLTATLVSFAAYFSWKWLWRRLGALAQSPLPGVGLLVACGLALWATVPHLKQIAETDSPARVTAPSPRNVLFIVVDTLRADHLPMYGYSQSRTPHLDAFARDAVRFEHAFVNASWTRPSFASLLTGRLPSSHGVMAKSDGLPEAVETLPEVLTKGGWNTFGVVTNFNVAPYFNFQQGFGTYEYLEPDFVLGADDMSAKLLLVQFLKQRIEKLRTLKGRVEPGAAYQDAKRVNENIFDWLNGTPKQPWMMFVGYMDPHDPYFVHPYRGVGYSRAANQKPRPEEASRLRTLYDGEIAYWDSEFGRLIARLKALGYYEQMTVIVTSDHGEEFGDHGGFWHGTTLYDEQLHVPLFVKLPNHEQGGSVVNHWVQSIDVMPTLLRQLGQDVPKGVQGGDLFRGTDLIYAEESHEGNVLEAVRERRETGPYKLIHANPNNPRGLKPTEVYDVQTDPQEQHDLADTRPTLVAQIQKTLKEAAKAARHSAVGRTPVNLEQDDDAEERLKALGYAADR